VVPVIKALKTKSLILDKSKDDVHFVTARWANEKGSYQEAVEAAEAVSERARTMQRCNISKASLYTEQSR